MNLTKYFMIKLPMDNSFGPGDIPSIWNLKKYDPPGTTMNWSGDSHDAYSVIIDSALGLLGAPPKSNAEFLEQVKWLQDYLRNAPPPKYPFSIDAARAEAGKAVFDAALRELPCERQDGPAHAARGGRHRPGTDGHLEQGQRHRREQGGRRDGHRAQGARRGAARRLQPAVSRRRVGARALSAQRLGAHAARSARAPRETAQGVLARLRSVRSGRTSDSSRRPTKPSASARRTTRASAPTATAGTCSASICRQATRTRCSNT